MPSARHASDVRCTHPTFFRNCGDAYQMWSLGCLLKEYSSFSCSHINLLLNSTTRGNVLGKEAFPSKSLSTERARQLLGRQVGHVVLVQAPELKLNSNKI